nr:hypothetical protein [uncultured Halomonas sp.]
MPDLVARIDAFPMDDRYWIVRWIDDYEVVYGRTATPSVGVRMYPSLTKPTRHDFLSPNLEEERECRVHTGLIPLLTLGSIYKNGLLVGRVVAETRTITLREAEASYQILKAADELPGRPEWYNKMYPYRVIKQKEYRLSKNALTSKCIVIENDEGVFILPCHEAFRAFMVPSTHFALALTSGPWETAKKEIINEEYSGLINENEWLITLRMRVKDAHRLWAANMCFTEEGNLQAKKVHSNALQQGKYWKIDVGIPFQPQGFSFEARTIMLQENPRKYLCIEVTRSTWPYPDVVIHYRRDNRNKADGEIFEKQALRPFTTVGRLPSEQSGDEFDITSEEDSASGVELANFDAPGLDWANPPISEKVEGEPSFKYMLDKAIKKDIDGLSKGSAGHPFHGETQSQPTTFDQSHQRMSERLLYFKEMLQFLEKKEMIYNLSLVAPEKQKLLRDDVVIWPLPGKLETPDGKKHNREKWALIDENSKRGVLVYSFIYLEQYVYSFELECRSGELGYCVLLLCIDSHKPLMIVENMINLCSLVRGRWRRCKYRLDSVPEITNYDFWTHYYKGNADTSGAEKIYAKDAFNADSFIGKLNKLVEY